MNFGLRPLRVLLGQRCPGSSSLLDDLRLSFHVIPHDLDLQMHMNNECCLTLMDPDRVALMKRTGLLAELHRLHGFGVADGIVVHFIRPLSFFRRVNLHTRVVSRDGIVDLSRTSVHPWRPLRARIRPRASVRAPGKDPDRTCIAVAGHRAPRSPGPVPAGFDSPRKPLPGRRRRVS